MTQTNAITNSTIRTKRGAASLYVVIFTTLLLGIITLSFIRIIISEVGQTGNTDLSQSAYDSALAGVEDAKVALLRYHDCLSGRSTGSNGLECNAIISAMQEGIASESCDVVRDTLNRSTAEGSDREEVIIQESNDSSSTLLQAYTCVKIAEELPDYRTTLNSSFRTRIIPIRTASMDDIDSISIKWYSSVNNSGSTSLNFMPSGSYASFQPKNDYTPPVISVQLIQAGQSFVPNTDFNVPAGNTTTNRAEVFLYPVSSGAPSGAISAFAYTQTANKLPDDSFDQFGYESDRIEKVNCNLSGGKEFACEAEILLPSPINPPRSDNATFVRVGLPYGTPTTDISLELHKNGGSGSSIVDFNGVQASVDSTGRANDLYRRIETRIELVDIYYPYPEFTVQLDGTSQSDGIYKQFYSTQNCWASDDGEAHSCNNNDQNNY